MDLSSLSLGGDRGFLVVMPSDLTARGEVNGFKVASRVLAYWC